MGAGASQAGIIATSRPVLVWPGASRPESVSYCVSSVMADAGITDTGNPDYTLSAITDQESSYGTKTWSGVSNLARVNAASLAFGGSAVDSYAQASGTANTEGLYSLLGTSNSTVSGGSNHFGSFVARCREIGVYGWDGTSFSQRNDIQITSTQCKWTHGNSSAGYETLNLTHGLDTSVTYRNWIAIFEGNGAPSVTWYADNVLLGTVNGALNYDFPFTSPTLKLGRASGSVSAIMAAAFFAKQLSGGERASFQS